MEKGLEGVCDTGLALGLGYKRKSSSTSTLDDQYSLISNMSTLEPILTLGLSGEPYGSPTMNKMLEDSTQSPTSNIKSEEINGEETVITEKISPRGSDDDEDVCARKKLRLTKDQSALLEERFKEHTTLNPKQKHALAKQLNLRPRQVEVWFQNRRARTKLKQTEVDCELLKRRCETLKDENQRLERELQELKALKLKSPLLMQFSKTSTMICPACKRITGGDHGPNGGPLMVAPPKHLFFNPFNTTHSAAC